jgi:hypothetical protein
VRTQRDQRAIFTKQIDRIISHPWKKKSSLVTAFQASLFNVFMLFFFFFFLRGGRFYISCHSQILQNDFFFLSFFVRFCSWERLITVEVTREERRYEMVYYR